MSNNLVKRLRDWQNIWTEDENEPEGHLYETAADRIEELEAKLRKCVGALGDISSDETVWPDDPQKELDWCRNRATTTLESLEAKLAQQDDLVQAAVAAKLREAAECCTAQLRNTAMLMSNPPQSSAAWDARNAILALITPDAQSALDRVVWAERERGFWLGRSCGGSKAEIDAALNALCQGGE